MSGDGRVRRALDVARVAVIPAFGAGAIVGLLVGVPVLFAAGASAVVGLAGGALVGAARG